MNEQSWRRFVLWYGVGLVVLSCVVGFLVVQLFLVVRDAEAVAHRAERLEGLVSTLPTSATPVRWAFEVGGQVLQCELANDPVVDVEPLYRCDWVEQ